MASSNVSSLYSKAFVWHQLISLSTSLWLKEGGVAGGGVWIFHFSLFTSFFFVVRALTFFKALLHETHSGSYFDHYFDEIHTYCWWTKWWCFKHMNGPNRLIERRRALTRKETANWYCINIVEGIWETTKKRKSTFKVISSIFKFYRWQINSQIRDYSFYSCPCNSHIRIGLLIPWSQHIWFIENENQNIYLKLQLDLSALTRSILPENLSKFIRHFWSLCSFDKQVTVNTEFFCETNLAFSSMRLRLRGMLNLNNLL